VSEKVLQNKKIKSAEDVEREERKK